MFSVTSVVVNSLPPAPASFPRDPENDMVIIMTRNSAGQNFGKYRKDFFKLIVDGIEKEE